MTKWSFLSSENFFLIIHEIPAFQLKFGLIKFNIIVKLCVENFCAKTYISN